MPNMILCADDYGMNGAVSQGIVELLAKQRLSAVSCMMNTPAWPQAAHDLQAYANTIDIGVHFNLTEGQSVSPQFQPQDIAKLIKLSYLKKINKAAVRNELEQQLQRFYEAFNRPPDFIDGHQHIQQLPIIRDAMLDVYQHHFPQRDVYIRVSGNGWRKSLLTRIGFPKPLIINMLGTRSLKKSLQQYRIPHNQHFSGIYSFPQSSHYRNYFRRFLQQTTQSSLIMCHPGLAATSKDDEIHQARYDEYRYFMSDDFVDDCQECHVRLRRFGQVEPR